jgi:hypothetical protein
MLVHHHLNKEKVLDEVQSLPAPFTSQVMWTLQRFSMDALIIQLGGIWSLVYLNLREVKRVYFLLAWPLQPRS